jgi:hypothetical protein
MKWGPYLSERQWGTAREDYSSAGAAWDYFTHDHARSRAYRWSEDGLAGISDENQQLCFALALWNGNDPILKERLFGLANGEGNHGEDVKEYYFYLDSTPTHSYMKYLYKYPQAATPTVTSLRPTVDRARVIRNMNWSTQASLIKTAILLVRSANRNWHPSGNAGIEAKMRQNRYKQSGEVPYFHLVPLSLSLIAFFGPIFALAQEMEARAYSRAPVGTQFVVISYAHQSGDVLTDSASPLSDVSVKLNLVSFAYGRTFNLAGRQANASVLVPCIRAKANGNVFEERHEITRSGLGDVRMRFSTFLIGGPALNPRDFAAYQPRTLLGVSLTVVAPTGEYDARRLVNLGSNRWSFKPEVGVSKPLGRWTFELAGGAWLFTPNKNFFGGSRREQKPLASFQTHVIYTLRRRMWVAFDATYYNGGRTVVNSVVKADVQSNSRVGATFSFPVTSRQSLRVATAKGLTSRFGGNLNAIAVGWQYAWLK